MKLLIVEDDLLTAEVVRDSIDWKELGIHETVMVHNAAGAKKIFEEDTPDIVLCDIEMPKESGLELLKWVRSEHYTSEFIFLTNHENFHFVSLALEYTAIGYLTKPLNIEKIKIAVLKAAEKINLKNELHRYSEYGQYWLNNKRLILENFWRDLLFNKITPEPSVIEYEATKRNLSIDLKGHYRLVLVSVIKSENQGTSWDDSSFEYILTKISSEVILEELGLENVIFYVTDRNYYVSIIVSGVVTDQQIKERCEAFINTCKKYLRRMVACYISGTGKLKTLAESRRKLEEVDQNNFILRSKVFFEGDTDLLNFTGQYAPDIGTLREMFEKGEKLKIVNLIKNDLELLVAKNSLDASTMYSIHQDFMQIVYAFLYTKGIQAHRLFSDPLSKQLNHSANNSVFDMMKWVHFISTRTIDYVEEVKKSESIIDKAKQFIYEHYMEDITRNDVAASVFLTPEYFAKLFKAETGIVIKDFINQCRIGRAKELLLNSDISISEIAFQVGFDNFSYFSTVFKKITGVSPQIFRKEVGE
ncbi:helix-turn-helix domain-containing protein [Paenibacillus sp. FSL R7-0345]|uniref:response regulator transcription factor n=1 Tax=Paenibacillus sp. FSL R7-0345 TaxID=2954535 RepID=UPI00315B0E00